MQTPKASSKFLDMLVGWLIADIDHIYKKKNY